jgi:hypothetical protein
MISLPGFIGELHETSKEDIILILQNCIQKTEAKGALSNSLK